MGKISPNSDVYSILEVPSARTGFSPAELLLGRGPRGPLQELRDAWTNETKETSNQADLHLYMNINPNPT